ncbi:MAG: hypothetical protein ABIA21_02180 [Candidatus Aenigmatarchaeota archaeon]
MITGIIPQTGRTCYSALSRLGDVSGRNYSKLVEILEKSKGRGTQNLEEAQTYLTELQGQGYPVTLQPDRKRAERPYRLSFLGSDIVVDGVKVRIEGAESHNCSSLIRLSEADFAIVGYDELLATMQTYLSIDKRAATRWGSFNAELMEPTDVRIAGSANLKYTDKETGRDFQDFDGFFFIGNKRRGYDDVVRILEHGQRLYVKGRYEGVILKAFPGIKTVPVKNVEDAVASNPDGLGVEIVRSGRTIKKKGLHVYGEPLFLSESLLVADYGQYLGNPDLQKVIDTIQPQSFFNLRRMDNFSKWYDFLKGNLNNNWIDRPDVRTLFEGSVPIESLRPYTIESHNWMPSNNLPADKKFAEVIFMTQVVPAVLSSGIQS